MSVFGLDSEVAGSSMDRVKDYIQPGRTFARPVIREVHPSHAGQIAREAGAECRRVLELGCGDRVIAIDPNPSDVALA